MGLPSNEKDQIVIPTAASYVVRILDTIKDYSKLIQCTPERGSWDPMFKRKTRGKWQVKNERNAAIREIAEEAAFFGYDLHQHLANLKAMTQDVEQE